ncbi:MAG: alpha/beta fold hydrolase [Nitrososphaerales archaeon]
MPTLLKDDLDIFYEKTGNGQPLILVHGSLGDYRDWRNQVSFFSNHGFEAMTYSRRNHFPNKWRAYPKDYSVKTERDDLFFLLESIEEKRVNLVGHSYGGFVAALFAVSYPNIVKSLVLAEPPIFTIARVPTKEVIFFIDHIIRPSQQMLQSGNAESAIKLFLDGISGMQNVFDHMKPSFKDIILENSKTALKEIEITPNRDPFSYNEASRINCPTLILKGQFSPPALQQAADQLAGAIPNSKISTISNSSHGMIWENPLEFNLKVLEFLGK